MTDHITKLAEMHERETGGCSVSTHRNKVSAELTAKIVIGYSEWKEKLTLDKRYNSENLGHKVVYTKIPESQLLTEYLNQLT